MRFNQWFVDIQHRAKRSDTEPVVRSMLMKSSGQCLRVAGLLHIVNTQGKHIPISLETTELAIAIVDQLFAETEAFHLKPSGLIDRLMERIRSIAKDTKKCPNGNVSYAQNRNHLGRNLKGETNARLFNEAIGLMVANLEGRVVKNDPVTWHP